MTLGSNFLFFFFPSSYSTFPAPINKKLIFVPTIWDDIFVRYYISICIFTSFYFSSLVTCLFKSHYFFVLIIKISWDVLISVRANSLWDFLFLCFPGYFEWIIFCRSFGINITMFYEIFGSLYYFWFIILFYFSLRNPTTWMLFFSLLVFISTTFFSDTFGFFLCAIFIVTEFTN